MSVTQVPIRPIARGSLVKLWLAIAALVEYVGTFDDGEIFDATQQPVPMIPMAVIPGFAEAMMKMQQGGRYKFRLPPELGYGASPPPGMKPDAALNFEVVVRQVAPGAGPALLQQQQMGIGR